MTKKKKALLDFLKSLKDSDNPEEAHVNADRALIAFIGNERISDAYDEIEKWYA